MADDRSRKKSETQSEQLPKKRKRMERTSDRGQRRQRQQRRQQLDHPSESPSLATTPLSILQNVLGHRPPSFPAHPVHLNDGAPSVSEHGPVYRQLIQQYPSLMDRRIKAVKRAQKYPPLPSPTADTAPTSLAPCVPCTIVGTYTSFDNATRKVLVRKVRNKDSKGPFRAKTDRFMTHVELYEARRDRNDEVVQNEDEDEQCFVPLSTAVRKCVRFLRRVEETVDEATLKQFQTIMKTYSTTTTNARSPTCKTIPVPVLVCEKQLQQLLSVKYPNLLLMVADFIRGSLKLSMENQEEERKE